MRMELSIEATVSAANSRSDLPQSRLYWRRNSVSRTQEATSVRPVTGMALVFAHHQLHEGCVVEKGTKYVMRTDVMYSAQ